MSDSDVSNPFARPATHTTPPVPADAPYYDLPRAIRIIETTQTVITALIFAFIFRAFLVEPFIIPTGSMAHALLGAHATCVCPACGWQFDFAPYAMAEPTGHGFVTPDEIICPNCQLRIKPDPTEIYPEAGDRILVHKWGYALGGPFKPRRWEVIVFRDPANPDQHYIKRLVGLPGETLEIIDGDLFVDGHIARKPPAVQRVMWMIVFDQDRFPRPDQATGRLPRWIAIEPLTDAWTGLQTRALSHRATTDTPHTIFFNPDTGRDYLLDLSGYNARSTGVFIGDARLVGEITLDADRAGHFQCELVRPPYRFVGALTQAGVATLRMFDIANPDAPGVLLAESQLRHPLRAGCPLAIELSHVDFRVGFRVGNEIELTSTDAQYSPDVATLRSAPGQRPLGFTITAAGLDLTLRHLRIDRDVHYTRSPHTRRADVGRPFTLEADEYFVLGDNSSDSHDSREWSVVGPHLPPSYRPGTVRANQIVGEAAFVYLPALLPVGSSHTWVVPDLGRVRFVR